MNAVQPVPTPSELGPRVAVVGTCGSGKSTLGRALAARLGTEHVELDALFHGPGWTPAEPPVFRSRVADIVDRDAWVIDGNYSLARDLVWGRATGVVWLDLPLPWVLWQLTTRTAQRLWTREELWNGNRETLANHLRWDGLLPWAVRTHGKHRRVVPALGAEYALDVVRLRSRPAVEAWLASP